MVFGINTLLVLVTVRHTGSVNVAGLGVAVLFAASTGMGSFLANFLTPVVVRRWSRYKTVNLALLAAAAIQLAAVGLDLPIMMACGFLLGAAGQVVKLCADSAMQLDVDDALRGHVFTVQDALFWVAFVGSIALSAAIIPVDGHSPPWSSSARWSTCSGWPRTPQSAGAQRRRTKVTPWPEPRA